MADIAILVMGEPVPEAREVGGDFAQMITATVGRPDLSWRVIDVPAGEFLPHPRDLAGVILTGSPSSVTERADWMIEAEAYLRLARDWRRPMLGICFGHQLMASAFGGRVVKNPNGIEMGTYAVRSGARLDNLGWTEATLDVQMCHGDTVVSVPRGASVLGASARDAHAAISYGPLCVSTQFHPEFSPEIMTAYLRHYRNELAAQGDDPDKLAATVKACPGSHRFLRRFVELVLTVVEVRDPA